MPEPRKVTTMLLELAGDGVLSWEAIAKAALGYMSEADVADMAHCEGLLPEEALDDEDEPDAE
jgi:hypothetical protein